MWVLPTYNRPDQCRAVLEQIISVGCSTKGLVLVQGSDGYDNLPLPDGWEVQNLGENIGVCSAMNRAFKRFPNEPFYGLICDDEYVYTPGWDIILSEAAGKWNISHGNEGWQSEHRIHSYVTVGGELVRTCGWWALPGLWHWFHDDVQEVLAKVLDNRQYCKDVKTEHKHYLAGKASKDNTYASGESKAAQDQQVFNNWLRHELPILVSNIKEQMRRNI